VTANLVILTDHSAAAAIMSDILEISATEFKTKCLALFKDLETRRLRKVVVTRHGKPSRS
jgi:hypothetical protein